MKLFTEEQVDRLWPETRAELLMFATALLQNGARRTASQLTMAIDLADRSFKRHKKKHPAPENKMMRPAPENKRA